MDEIHERGELDWLNLTNWEQECVDEVERTPDIEPQLQNEKDIASQKLWMLFQNAATCVAQLYKDRQQNVSLWVPFQNAASSVTSLYKECIESQRQFLDLGTQCGVQRRNKDLLAWAKRRKRHIRREDLIAFLSGKSPPPSAQPRVWSSPRQRICLDGVLGAPHHLHHLNHQRQLAHHHLVQTSRLAFQAASEMQDPEEAEEADLQTFREALSVSNGFRQSPLSSPPCSPTSNGNGSSRSNSVRNRSQLAELNAFIADEFTRHFDSRKRASSNTDVIMDSPTHKRSRLS